MHLQIYVASFSVLFTTSGWRNSHFSLPFWVLVETPLPCNKNSDGLIKEICKLSNYQFVQHIPLTYLPLLTSSSSFTLVALALKNFLPFVLVKLSSNWILSSFFYCNKFVFQSVHAITTKYIGWLTQ